LCSPPLTKPAQTPHQTPSLPIALGTLAHESWQIGILVHDLQCLV
jgi:hypothetical protein